MRRRFMVLFVLICCLLLTGCGGMLTSPPNIGMSVDEFVDRYNNKITSAHLQVNKQEIKKTGTVKREKSNHEDGYGRKNYNYTHYLYIINPVDVSFIFFVDDDSNKIFWIKMDGYTINKSTIDDVIKVFRTAADVFSENNSKNSLSNQLEIDNLRKYNGHNKFFNYIDHEKVSCAYRFGYSDISHQDTVGLDFYTKDSDFAVLFRKELKKQPLKGIVPNPKAGNHTVDLTLSHGDGLTSQVPATNSLQATVPPPSNPPETQIKQNEQPPKPHMKKEIPGTEAINGFWNGDPNYPVIATGGNMTKIADKSSVKFSKSANEELITMDVYGFTKAQGQCWQETFTFQRKGRTSNYYSSIADPSMLMEFVHDSAVHEAYRIACETAGVPLEMAPSR